MVLSRSIVRRSIESRSFQQCKIDFSIIQLFKDEKIYIYLTISDCSKIAF